MLTEIAEWLLAQKFSEERPFRVASARVIWSNETLLVEDFPSLCDSVGTAGGRDRRDIVDRWLLSNAAVISARQVELSEVNSPLPVSGSETVRALRPPRYGRSLIVEVANFHRSPACTQPQSTELLDIKGCGVSPTRTPRVAPDANGLLSLPSALRELAAQAVVEQALERADVNVKGVPVYAVIDLGFTALFDDGECLPAALLVRRAHRRPSYENELPSHGGEEYRVKAKIELVLRLCGLTSVCSSTKLKLWQDSNGRACCQFGKRSPAVLPKGVSLDDLPLNEKKEIVFGTINVQLANAYKATPLAAELVDFGHYQATDESLTNIFLPVADRGLNWGGVLYGDEFDLSTKAQCRVDANAFREQPPLDGAMAWGRFPPHSIATRAFFRFGLNLAFKIYTEDITREDIMTRLEDFKVAAFSRS